MQYLFILAQKPSESSDHMVRLIVCHICSSRHWQNIKKCLQKFDSDPGWPRLNSVCQNKCIIPTKSVKLDIRASPNTPFFFLPKTWICWSLSEAIIHGKRTSFRQVYAWWQIVWIFFSASDWTQTSFSWVCIAWKNDVEPHYRHWGLINSRLERFGRYIT